MASYAYDGGGLRTSKTVTAPNTNGLLSALVTTSNTFVYDQLAGLPLILTDGQHAFVYGPGGMVVEQLDQAGTPVYLQTDQQGSTRQVTNQAGAVVATATFDAYGNPTASTLSSGAGATPVGYTGAYTDRETGLLWLRARYYEPKTGVFLTRDPALASTGQPYQYAAGDPLNAADPSGLCLGMGGGSCGDVVFNVLESGPGKNVTSFAVGLGDGATGGFTVTLRNGISPGSSCTFSHGVFYYGGVAVGFVSTAAVTGGGSAVARAEGGVARTETAIGEESVSAEASTVAKTCTRGVLPNSFTGDTPVLMADGTTKPIKDVKLGDKVLATDPETGETRAEPVTRLIRHSGPHAMDEVQLSDGTRIEATDQHPFWDETRNQFVYARDLVPGDQVRTLTGLLQVTAVASYWADLTAYNLTVDTIHTYYAGSQPVLVHNSCFTPTDGASATVDDVLTAGERWLGPGYTEPVAGSGRYVSAGGTRVFRIGKADITGAHSGGPHANFEELVPNPAKPGKMKVGINLHVFFTD